MIILIEVGGMIGPLPTVGLVVLTAICGVWLLRLEGMATLTRVQEKLQRGEIPESELLEGIMLIIGGALLLTPGFATDIVGFVCLIPGLRRPWLQELFDQPASDNFRCILIFRLVVSAIPMGKRDRQSMGNSSLNLTMNPLPSNPV